jgi:CubicO group peptidase (beta-lactamase class C family)
VFSPSTTAVDISKRLQEENILGVQCGVLRIDEKYTPEIALKSLGNNECNNPVTDQTLSQCASLSKPVAACWLINYCIKSDVDLFSKPLNELIDDSAEKHGFDYFEGWRLLDEEGQRVNTPLSHFISHTSGLGGHYVYGCNTSLNVQHPLSILKGDEVKGLPKQHPVQFVSEPCLEMSYSGTSYVLIEMLTVQLSGGHSYHEIMRKFLDRLQMHYSTFDYHSIDESALLSCQSLRFPGAAAGMYTTVKDYLLFVSEIINAYHDKSSIIDKLVAKIMLTPALNQRDFIGLDPAHGFFVISHDNGTVTFAHQGANENYRVLIIGNTSVQLYM